ncbi:hypothetical protein V1478_011982 [Vespula squamosa]|uniref:Uncharacterized protein n=1 Tax=Vespula squamosa TaxID=30214 RepID=A0ABD2ABW7_VESSQ
MTGRVIESVYVAPNHAGHADFRVESPLARGSPDAATSTWWDLGRTTGRMAAYFNILTKSLFRLIPTTH